MELLTASSTIASSSTESLSLREMDGRPSFFLGVAALEKLFSSMVVIAACDTFFDGEDDDEATAGTIGSANASDDRGRWTAAGGGATLGEVEKMLVACSN